MIGWNLARRTAAGVIRGERLADAFEGWKGKDERWLFVAPHDDDLCLGAGLLMLKAVEEGIPVHVVITTDGRMGYGSTTPQDQIVTVRKVETLDSFQILGVNDVKWLDFPDGSLARHAGVREAREGDPCVVGGQTGIQNAFTAKLREHRPTRVFVPAGSDLHPDHKTVHQELLISLFHAAGDIWPQLGEPLASVPDIYEMAIYCDFTAPPTIRLTAPSAAFERKLDSVLAYRSQQQIASLVENVRKSGPVEFFRPADFHLYVPAVYNSLFD
jgi:LmbE family N-acetylglucosaminyl deacetylase